MVRGFTNAYNNAVAKATKKLGRFYKSSSGGGGGGGGGEFNSDTFLNIAKAAVVVIVLIVVAYFLIGILGGTLVPTLPTNSNISTKVTQGINNTLSLSSTIFEIVIIVVIIAAIGVAIKYLLNFFKS
ncbi:MAG: hypothetical protein QXX36_03615 [Candidatus Rehaiarchaeum fermentans]|nr:hypothetical protein [Candidatus Rehaiarchaeum fermentans]